MTPQQKEYSDLKAKLERYEMALEMAMEEIACASDYIGYMEFKNEIDEILNPKRDVDNT